MFGTQGFYSRKEAKNRMSKNKPVKATTKRKPTKWITAQEWLDRIEAKKGQEPKK